MDIPKKILARQYEITADFLSELDKHLLDIVEEKAIEMFELRDFANILHIHPTHLTNTVKLATGKHPCSYYEDKILTIAKNLLQNNENSIASVAKLLTYDPSNFTKFFKKYAGETPKHYRENYFEQRRLENTEMLTI